MNKLKTIASYYRVRTFIFTIVSFVIFAFSGCHHGTNNQPEGFKTFWGDSATVFIAKNPQNGYRISIIKNKDLTLAHFERGDSLGNPSSVKVVREEYHQFNSDIETIETPELKDYCGSETGTVAGAPDEIIRINYEIYTPKESID